MNITIPHPSKVAAVFRFAFWDGPRALWRGVCRHPKLWTAFLTLVALTVLLGHAAGYAMYLPVLLIPWRLAQPVSFARFVTDPCRSDWRRWRRYQSRWPDVSSLNGLSEVIDDGLDVHPEIVKARTIGYSRDWMLQRRWPLISSVTTCTDRLWIRPLIGKTLEDHRDAAPAIAEDYGAREARAYPEQVRPKGTIRLELKYGPDPLAVEIPALPIPESSEDIDLERIPIGLTEDGRPWTISVLLHLLLAGQTGSGKSGVLQGLLRGVAPMIRDGLVEVYAIDMKEGMEFGDSSGLFKQFANGTLQDCARLLADVVTLAEERGRRMAALKQRKHVATVHEPLILVVIDEMVELTDVKGMSPVDKPVGALIAGSMNQLLRKGRAKGVIVIGALTDARVDVLPMRRHFPFRIGMRLETKQETTMILGQGARERGAFCEDIPTGLPGVGFAMMDGDREATRVRAARVDDQDIAEMVADYAPRRELVPVD